LAKRKTFSINQHAVVIADIKKIQHSTRTCNHLRIFHSYMDFVNFPARSWDLNADSQFSKTCQFVEGAIGNP